MGQNKRLAINDEKAEVIVFLRMQHISMNKENVFEKSTHKFLGITLESCIHFKDHPITNCEKMSRQHLLIVISISLNIKPNQYPEWYSKSNFM